MPFDAFFNHISTALGGMPLDHIKMITSVLLTYPYAVIFNHLPDNPTIKHLFSIIITTVTFVWFHGIYFGFAQILASSLFVYFFMKYNKGKSAPLVVFVLTMMHMSCSHIIRQMKGYLGDNNFDHTAPQMVLTIKLTSFAFNVYDGTKPITDLSDYQRSKQVRTYPTLLSYLGWVFFFGGFLGGPAFEFSDYVNFIDKSVFAVTDKETGKTKIVKPDGTWPALEKLSVSLGCAALLTALGPHFDILDSMSPVWMARPFWYKLIFVQIGSFCIRLKYYTIWLMAEGACILCGLGFNGYDPVTGKAKWNRMPNISVFAYEKAQNVKEVLEAWNMRTNVWLKNYVYLRVTQPGKKPGFTSTLVTFGTSALWHGFHPGYYLTFISGALLQNTAKHLRRNLRPLVFTPDLKQPLPIKTAYDIAGYILTQTAFNYVVMPFILLSLKDSINLWRSLYFYTHVGILAIELFFAAGGKAWCQSVQRRRIEKAGLKLKEVPETNKVIVAETGIPETVADGGVQVGKVKMQ